MMRANRERVFFQFVNSFWGILWHIRQVVLAQLVLIVLGALGLVWMDEMGLGDALYFSFITGLTIGYGDLAVTSIGGRIVAVLIGLVGILFTGLIVAAAVKAVQVITVEEPRER